MKLKKPFVVWGQGCDFGTMQKKSLKRLLETSGIPAAWTILGLSALPTDHPSKSGNGGNARKLCTEFTHQRMRFANRYRDAV